MGGKLSDFKVLTFDCYGTLIDWETGIWDALQPLLVANGRDDVGRRQALEAFGALEHRQETERPGLLYADILAEVHRGLALQFDLDSTAELDAAFANSLGHWPAFPDTAEALRFLATRYRLVILSNVSRAGFAASNRKLGVEFDAVYTAEDIGSYKPAPANFEYLLEHLGSDFGFGPADVLHTAQSLFHDHVPAKAIGLANAWIDRQRLSQKGEWGATAKVDEMPEIDYVFFSMQELAEAVKTE